MNAYRIYRRWLLFSVVIAFLFLGFFTYRAAVLSIPDSMMVKAGEGIGVKPAMCQVYVETREAMSDGGQKISGTSGVNVTAPSGDYVFQNTGTYSATYKLFGLIDLKEVEINVVENQRLLPGGYPVGIYVETEGVMIIGTGSVTGMDGEEREPAKNIVKSGDYVVSINGSPVTDKNQLLDQIQALGGEDVELGIRRNGEDIRVRVKPVQTARDEYKLGIWIRDNTQGVGMITYVKEDGGYGALGHGIADVDTGLLMRVKNGSLFQTRIVSIVRGEAGNPGELVGMIDYEASRKLGEIQKNVENGIFGTLQDVNALVSSFGGSAEEGDYVEAAAKEEIRLGEAAIQTCVDGSVRQYAVQIEDVNLTDGGNKGITLRVTDPALLEKTGGIVQGISGSPILQDGKIIGAVTHVFVNDPTRGYGIFVENMLKQEAR